MRAKNGSKEMRMGDTSTTMAPLTYHWFFSLSCYISKYFQFSRDSMLPGSWALVVQLTAECPYTLQWATLPPSKFSLPTGMWNVDPHLMRGSLGPSESSTQTASRSVKECWKSVSIWQN